MKNNWNKKKLYYYNNKYTPFCLHKKKMLLNKRCCLNWFKRKR